MKKNNIIYIFIIIILFISCNKQTEKNPIKIKIQKLEKKLKYDNNKLPIYYELAELYFSIKNNKNAIKYYKKSLIYFPEIETLNKIFNIYINNNQYDEAEKYFYDLLKKNIGFKKSDIYIFIFKLYEIKKKYQKIITIYDSNKNEFIKNDNMNEFIIKMFLTNKDLYSAEMLIKNLLENNKNNYIYIYYKGLIKMILGENNKAYTLFNKSISLYNKSNKNNKKFIYLAKKNIAIIYYMKKQYVKAITMLETIKDKVTNKYEILYYLGKSYYNEDNFINALENLNTAFEIKKTKELVELLYDITVYKNKIYKEAETILLSYLKKYENDVEIWQKLGDLYYIENKYSDSILSYSKVIELDPISNYSKKSFFAIASIYKKTNHINKAISQYKIATKYFPKNWKLWFNLGNLYDDNNFLEKAIISYNKTIKLNPKFSKTYVNLGNVYVKLNQLKKALNLYKKSLQLKYNKEAYYNYKKLKEYLKNLNAKK